MELSPNITLAANLFLFGLMLWRKCRKPYIWAIQGPVILGTLLLKWDDWRYDLGSLSATGYNLRLRYSHDVQWACELGALIALAFVARRRRECHEADLFVVFAAVLHLLSRLDWIVNSFPHGFENADILFRGHVYNLILIASLAWAVCCSQRECAEEGL